MTDRSRTEERTAEPAEAREPPESPRSSMQRRVAALAVRLVLGLGLAGFLLYYTLRTNGTSLSAVLSHASPLLLATALIVYGLVILITAARWNLLLRTQGIRLHPWEVTRLTLIGVFFNLAIPGAVGGDLVKMAFVARRTHGRRTEAVMTVILDRVVGLIALFFVSAALVLAFLPVLQRLSADFPEVAGGAYLVGAGSIAGLLGVVLVEIRERLVRHPLIARILALAEGLSPQFVLGVVRRMVGAIEACRRDRRRIATAFLLAILVHLSLGVDFLLVGRAVGERHVAPTGYLLATQVGNAAGAVPVTPSGLGTRDTVVARFLHAFGGKSQLAGGIPVVMSMIMVFWSMVGAVVFVFSKGVRDVWLEEVRCGTPFESEGNGGAGLESAATDDMV